MKAQRGVQIQLYSFFNLGAGCRGVVNDKLRLLYAREKTQYICAEGWMGPEAGPGRCRKYRLHRDTIPGRPSPWRVVIPTELSRQLALVS